MSESPKAETASPELKSDHDNKPDLEDVKTPELSDGLATAKLDRLPKRQLFRVTPPKASRDARKILQAQRRNEVYKILSKQQDEHGNDVYVCLRTKGSARYKLTTEQLARANPTLLEEFKNNPVDADSSDELSIGSTEAKTAESSPALSEPSPDEYNSAAFDLDGDSSLTELSWSGSGSSNSDSDSSAIREAKVRKGKGQQLRRSSPSLGKSLKQKKRNIVSESSMSEPSPEPSSDLPVAPARKRSRLGNGSRKGRKNGAGRETSRGGTRRPVIELSGTDELESSDNFVPTTRAVRRAKGVVESDEESDEESDRMHDLSRGICDKCGEPHVPELITKLLKNKRKRKKRAGSDDEFDYNTDSEVELMRKLGAFIECSTCAASFHFHCLPPSARDAILKELINDELKQDGQDGTSQSSTSPRGSQTSNGGTRKTSPDSSIQGSPNASSHPPGTNGSPSKLQSSIPPSPEHEARVAEIERAMKRKIANADERIESDRCHLCSLPHGLDCSLCRREFDIPNRDEIDEDSDEPVEKLFRCMTCKRPYHYGCLGNEVGISRDKAYLTFDTTPKCLDCQRWHMPAQHIIAWAPEEFFREKRRSEMKIVVRPSGSSPGVGGSEDGSAVIVGSPTKDAESPTKDAEKENGSQSDAVLKTDGTVEDQSNEQSTPGKDSKELSTPRKQNQKDSSAMIPSPDLDSSPTINPALLSNTPSPVTASARNASQSASPVALPSASAPVFSTRTEEFASGLASNQAATTAEGGAPAIIAAAPPAYTKEQLTKFPLPSIKDPSYPARYLIKWEGLSYRKLEWVPHAFLVKTSRTKLQNFLQRGSTLVTAEADEDETEEDRHNRFYDTSERAPVANPYAEQQIPSSWKLVDRVLDAWYTWGGNEERSYETTPRQYRLIKYVSTAYLKWQDLQYEHSTIETPPAPGDVGYDDYLAAYNEFLASRRPEMSVPKLSPLQLSNALLPKDPAAFKPAPANISWVKGGDLKEFQREGVNFMYYKWWLRSGCILADEMGLGKTVQIIALLSLIHMTERARPFLIVVPNSTVGNWLRELRFWAPELRTVAYAGSAASRAVCERNELFASDGRTLRADVVLTTFVNAEQQIALLRRVQLWEVLVVDEGQRLKGGEQLKMFKNLVGLPVAQRILLSGTPLNNSVPEIFNLLAFLDPRTWGSREAELRHRYEVLTQDKIVEVRETLRPYLLRRTKQMVLKLPPLTEIVVPITMTPLQKGLYKSILEQNAALVPKMPGGLRPARRTQTNNILMHLRKLLNHPYLIEPLLAEANTAAERFKRLTEASAKLILLHLMLPRLQAQGHRVLIFSQFKLVFNVIEEFLAGLGMRYLRLDGDTSQYDRQRGIDAFNAPGSQYTVYLLTTRAGGVGINLTSADTVILYDQDFNPHQDIQAISRAHRMGQTKPVTVFRLLMKGTCEEKILQVGMRKLGLDHLIIKNMDTAEPDEDIESILQYGAKALFEETDNSIVYTGADVDALIERAASADEERPPMTEAEAQLNDTFAHARIWEGHGGTGGGGRLVNAGEELEAAVANKAEEDAGFWNQLLEQKAAEDAEKAAAALTTRRARRKVNYTDGDAIVDDDFGDMEVDQNLSDTSYEMDDQVDDDGDEYGEPMYEISRGDEDVQELLDGQDPRNGKRPRSGLTGPISAQSANLKTSSRISGPRYEKRKLAFCLLKEGIKQLNVPELTAIMTERGTEDSIAHTEMIQRALNFLTQNT